MLGPTLLKPILATHTFCMFHKSIITELHKRHILFLSRRGLLLCTIQA